jgi:diguanylate cyclase (GGDEF)-like protein
MSESMHATPGSGPGVFSLTQIRHLMRVEFSRAQRYSYPVSCIAVSCDRMGHLRDLYGYEFRESVMDEVVTLLQRSTRACDYLGRLMDDRLLAILPHTTLEGAETLAGRLVKQAHSLEFAPDGRPLQVTLSVGMSHYLDDNTMFFDSLVESAEGALLEAMEAGGDRFVHQDPGPGSSNVSGKSVE